MARKTALVVMASPAVLCGASAVASHSKGVVEAVAAPTTAATTAQVWFKADHAAACGQNASALEVCDEQ